MDSEGKNAKYYAESDRGKEVRLQNESLGLIFAQGNSETKNMEKVNWTERLRQEQFEDVVLKPIADFILSDEKIVEDLIKRGVLKRV